MTHPCIGYEPSKEPNDPPNSCVGCTFLTNVESDWGVDSWECNRSEHELPYRPEIKEWIPYPYIPVPKENTK